MAAQEWAFVGVFLSLILCGLATCFDTQSRRDTRLPLLFVVPLGILVLGTIQLTPSDMWQDWVRRAVVLQVGATAPDNATERHELPIPSLAQNVKGHWSVYPASTRIELSRLGMATTALFMGVVLFSTRRAQLWLWFSLAIVGAVQSLFGIIQQLTWNGYLYWSVPVPPPGGVFGSFANSNNGAGYLNICLAAAIGCTVHVIYSRSHSGSGGDRTVAAVQTGSSAPGQMKTGILSRIAGLSVLQLTTIGLVAIIVAGVIMSLSRGAILSMIVACVVAIAVTSRGARRWWAIGALILALLLGIGVVQWVGFDQDAWKRLETLEDLETAAEPRVGQWRQVWREVYDSPWLGTGLGTYRYAHQPYLTKAAHVWYRYADNQYFETLIEAGIPGVLLGGVGILLVGLAILRLARSKQIPAHDGVVAVGLVLLITQMAQAFFDYGLVIAASNLLAFCTVCGAITGRATRLTDASNLRCCVEFPVLRRRIGIVACGLILWCLAGLNEIRSAATVHAAIDTVPQTFERVQHVDTPESLPIAQVDAGIEHMTDAIAIRPDHAELHRALAHLWIYRFRLGFHAILPDASPRPDIVDWDPWKRTHLAVVHERANWLQRTGNQAGLTELRTDPIVEFNLRPALRHLEAAYTACPRLPGLSLNLACLCFLDPNADPSGEFWIRRAVVLHPGDMETCFLAGLLAHQIPRDSLARYCWRWCLTIGRQRDSDILRLSQQLWGFDVFLTDVVPDKPEVQLDIAARLFARPTQHTERERLISRARQLIQKQRFDLSPGEYDRLSARAFSLQGDPRSAIEAYRRALALEPDKVDWRVEFVRLLKSEGRWVEARNEARLCVEQKPNDPAIQQLVLDLRGK